MTLWTMTIVAEWDDRDRGKELVFREWTRLRSRIPRLIQRLGWTWLRTSWDPRPPEARP